MLATLAITAGCDGNKYYHQPGGPYYFKHGVTYQGFLPNEEMTKSEADALAASGYAYAIAYFNPDGLPTNVQKIYHGKTEFSAELTWTNSRPISTRVTDAQGKVTDTVFDANGRPINPKPAGGAYVSPAARDPSAHP
jgi:hypothetical protein